MEYMRFNKDQATHAPLFVTLINNSYLMAAYKGSLSEFDILIKYRQKLKNGKWSLIRTPKHIHWAVDVLIKMHNEKELTQQFLDFLLRCWDETQSFKSERERKERLNINNLLQSCQQEITKFEELGKSGEYSIKFLILLAKLLMIQEKTNLETAYMFKRLLQALRSGEDIFKIVSLATHR